MHEVAVRKLEELARADATVAMLALLHAETLRAAADPTWQAAVPELSRAHLSDGLPALHGQKIVLETGRVRSLLVRLTAIAGRAGHAGAGPLLAVVEHGDADPLGLVTAGILYETDRLHALSDARSLDVGLLATLVHLAPLPLLLACGRAAVPLLSDVPWEAGFCPVCAAWPVLAELRGLERTRWLRCGRCGAGWPVRDLWCSFCGNGDFREMGYLAPDSDRESQRAVTCDRCGGYLKTVATLGPLAPAELGFQDLITLELDVAAIDAGYMRPDPPAFPLNVCLEPAVRRAGRLGWRR